MIANNKEAVRREVESIVKWTDEAFNSMKRVIAHHKPVAGIQKEAALEVGIAYDNNITTEARADTSLLAQLNEAFSGVRFGRQ